MGWAKFWAIFSQTHLATLELTYLRCEILVDFSQTHLATLELSDLRCELLVDFSQTHLATPICVANCRRAKCQSRPSSNKTFSSDDGKNEKSP
jgi:hypothetical protein